MANRPAVLVTRPAGQEADLCRAVTAAGFVAHSQPLLELTALPSLAPEQRRRLLDLDCYRHIVFVSGNAVRFGMAWIEALRPRLPGGINWYAVGEATAGLLRAHGVEVFTPAEEMTSEGLLALPRLQRVAGDRVLIVKGEGGRSTLREELSRRGARVEELACYRRSCPSLAPGELAGRLQRWGIGIILLSSGEGLANLVALLAPQEFSKLRHVALIVPSARVADAARQAGFDHIVTADNASDAAMLAALNGCAPSGDSPAIPETNE
jgi:uroporphyrinogen-III synthase